MNKLQKANKIVKEHMRKNCEKDSWRYEDFVTHDRFLDEIQDDEGVDIARDSAEDLAQHAIEQIGEVCALDFV